MLRVAALVLLAANVSASGRALARSEIRVRVAREAFKQRIWFPEYGRHQVSIITQAASGYTVSVRGETGVHTVRVSNAGKVGKFSRNLLYGRGSAVEKAVLFMGRGGTGSDGMAPQEDFLVHTGTVHEQSPDYFRNLSRSGKSMRVVATGLAGSPGYLYLRVPIIGHGKLGKVVADPTSGLPAQR